MHRNNRLELNEKLDFFTVSKQAKPFRRPQSNAGSRGTYSYNLFLFVFSLKNTNLKSLYHKVVFTLKHNHGNLEMSPGSVKKMLLVAVSSHSVTCKSLIVEFDASSTSFSTTSKQYV